MNGFNRLCNLVANIIQGALCLIGFAIIMLVIAAIAA